MFCFNCGAQTPDAAEFCPSCGARLAGSSGPIAGTSTVEAGKVPGGLLAGALVCSALALIFLPPVLGGIAIYLGHRARKYNESTGTTLMIVAGIATAIGMVFGAFIVLSA